MARIKNRRFEARIISDHRVVVKRFDRKVEVPAWYVRDNATGTTAVGAPNITERFHAKRAAKNLNRQNSPDSWELTWVPYGWGVMYLSTYDGEVIHATGKRVIPWWSSS